ncbi:MAG: type VI secretion system-associated protein TagF [Rhodoferax sp.]
MERPSASGRPASAAGAGAAPAEFAWYGKLPGAGDFVSRRMPYALQQFWDRWCAAGMELLKTGNPAVGWELWRNTPKWAFLLPAQPGVPVGQFGVWAPSCDRVGRNFPILVSSPLTTQWIDILLPRVATLVLAWSDVIGQVQVARQGADVLDARLESVLLEALAAEPEMDDTEKTLPRGMNPATLPWPDLAGTFDVQGGESYWWSVPPASSGFRARTHVGALTPMHFVALCT